jgi:hypothetical protein
MVSFTESVVEAVALAWLESLGYAISPEIARGELFAERAATRAKNATVRFWSNVQNLHIAISGSWEGLFRF